MESALAIANYFVEKSLTEKVELTPMKLVKIVYIAHGWLYGVTNGKHRLLDEDAQAWKYGPVIESVYQKFRKYGAEQITNIQPEDFTIVDGRISFQKHYPEIKDKGLYPFLDRVWDVYKKYTGPQLSALTHQAGTPWDIAYNTLGGKERNGVKIPNEIIAEHYKSLLSRNGGNN